MIHVSCARLVTAVLFGVAACIVLGGTLAASRHTHSVEVELDHLIPRQKWAGAGLNKLTVAEQQTLADDITALLEASRATGTPAGKDRSQWRTLHRGMSKDDVRKLLGEPDKVSASRFSESWYYVGGTVTFDGKGRVDSWNEN